MSEILSSKIEAKDLASLRTCKEIKAVLKAEGNTHSEDPQFSEWWDIFELIMWCDKSNLSGAEKWCVLRGRFKLERRK